MFEDLTYDVILRRMLDRAEFIANNQGFTIDKRTGSMIYFALAPAALELSLAYIELNEVLNESFADTQSRDFLIRRAAERGITPEPPDPGTMAIRQGEFSMDVPIGSRFSLNRLNYVVTEQISTGIFKLQCETPGIAGNQESGALVPIDYIDGLEWARLTDILIPGEDGEPTERFRQRYFDSLNSQAFGGNIRDYIDKTTKIQGVGGLKVYRAWDGGGTVKLVILDSQFKVPSSTLIDEVQSEIDPEVNQGDGMGIAPIGHIVTVVGASETQIDITTQLTFASGWDFAQCLPFIEQAIDDYFTELAESWDRSDWINDPTISLVVRISQIETRILSLIGILDIQNTLINGLPQNIQLGPDNIPVRGNITNV